MRFSLRALLLATTLTCVYVAMVCSAPPMIGFMFMLLFQFILPAVVVAGVLYARQGWKAFFIGATIGGIAPMLIFQWYLIVIATEGIDDLLDADWSTYQDDSTRSFLYLCAVVHLFVLLSGLAAVAVRWSFRSSRPLVGGNCLD